MSEQQRVNLAIFLCLVIFTGYYFLMPKPPPATPAPTATEQELPRPDLPPPSAPRRMADEDPDAPTPEEVVLPEVLLNFETPLYRGQLSNETLGLRRYELLTYDERPEGDGQQGPVSLVMGKGTAADADQPLQIDQARVEWLLGGTPLPRARGQQVGETIFFTSEGATGLHAEVSITPRADAYALDYVLNLKNNSAQSVPAGAKVTMSMRSTGEGGSWFTPPADLVQGLCAIGADVNKESAKNLRGDGPYRAGPPISFAGIDRQYFLIAAIPDDAGRTTEARCTLRAEGETILVDMEFPETALAPRGEWQQRYSVYLGPKRDESLRAGGDNLSEVIDYNIGFVPLGFLARPMVYLLNTFHGWTQSWGMAIIMLTFFVKLLLFPITLKSSMSMRKMQLLKPELDRIRKQFDKDRERQQMEQLKLFREKGVNPVGGCLPMLLQMPVWFALYRSLWTAVDLYQQPFLWISDLTAPESFPFLAILFAVLTVIQQRLTPMTMDNQQAKIIMYVMPVMFALFMISFPSGLVLYIVINSVLTIFQQLAINSRQVSLN